MFYTSKCIFSKLFIIDLDGKDKQPTNPRNYTFVFSMAWKGRKRSLTWDGHLHTSKMRLNLPFKIIHNITTYT